jgi:hypothetical protein
VVVESAELKMNQDRIFVDDYDSVKVYFSFGGPNLPLVMTVENKTKSGIFIDWERTAFLVDGYLHSVVNPNSKIDITSSTNIQYIGDDFMRTEVSMRSSDLAKKYIPPNTRFQFKVRDFYEFAPQNEEAARQISLIASEDKIPMSSLIQPNVYSDYLGKYSNIKVMMPITFEYQEDKNIQLNRTFYVTQQYRVRGHHYDQLAQRMIPLGDRGYFPVVVLNREASTFVGILYVGSLIWLFSLLDFSE